MNRSLTLGINPHRDGGISLTVIHAEVEGDESTSDSHKNRVTEKLPGIAAVKKAASDAIDEYFERVKSDGTKAVKDSPLGRAIDKAKKDGAMAETGN